MSEPLRNYSEAAAWLGVSRRWLEVEVQAGRVPYTKIGQKHVRFTQAHLDAIVAAGEHMPGGSPAASSEPAATTEAPKKRPVVVGRRQRQKTPA